MNHSFLVVITSIIVQLAITLSSYAGDPPPAPPNNTIVVVNNTNQNVAFGADSGENMLSFNLAPQANTQISCGNSGVSLKLSTAGKAFAKQVICGGTYFIIWNTNTSEYEIQ
jgi:hypothetical protein